MAEAKRSFILYTDLIHTVKKMPKEKAGELLMVILSYVNDLNPIIDDILVDLVFEPIKQQLKRDLDRWESEKETKSQNGLIGNLKRWNIDLYDKFISKELTLDQALEIANNRKPSLPDELLSQDIANIAVNVSVSDSVTVSDTKDKKASTGKPEDVDCEKFIVGFNSIAKRSFRATNKIKNTLKSRLKVFSKEDIWSATKNAHKDSFHIDNNFKHLTPEYILREDILDKYLNILSAPSPVGYIPVNNKIDHSNRI